MPAKPIPPDLLSLRRHNAVALFVRWRLQEIAQGRVGGDKAFAEAVGMDPAHWSRLKGGTPLGPRLARRLETACGVPAGWLDQPHDAPAAHAADGIELLPAGQGTDALLGVLGPGAALTLPQVDHSTPAGFPSPAADCQAHAVDLV
jgi:hypothetical protein